MATRGDAGPCALSGEPPPLHQGAGVRRLGRGTVFAEPMHAFASIRRVKTLVIVLATLAAALAPAMTAHAAPPRLAKQGSTQQLIVDGKPFLILGGELGNSSSSSAEYMRPHWPRLK